MYRRFLSAVLCGALVLSYPVSAVAAEIPEVQAVAEESEEKLPAGEETVLKESTVDTSLLTAEPAPVSGEVSEEEALLYGAETGYVETFPLATSDGELLKYA